MAGVLPRPLLESSHLHRGLALQCPKMNKNVFFRDRRPFGRSLAQASSTAGLVCARLDGPLARGKHVLSLRHVVCQAKKKAVEEAFDTSDPWLGAVIFSPETNRRSYTFITTLERLGLGDLSSASSVSEAADLLVAPGFTPDDGAPDLREQAKGTAVVINMNVAGSGQDLLADGTVDTVFGLQCTRCLAPTTYKVEADFQLLLSATPVVEPTLRSMGVVIGDRRWDGEDDDENFLDGMDGAGSSTGLLDLDLDDKIHFPRNRKSIDLSKYFRDTVHLELPLKLLCKSSCKGTCFNCGKNLNVMRCSCDSEADGLHGGSDSGGGNAKGSLGEQLRSELQKKQRGW